MRQKAPAALRLPGRARWSASQSLRVAPLRAAHRSLPANTPGQSRRGKLTPSRSRILPLGQDVGDSPCRVASGQSQRPVGDIT